MTALLSLAARLDDTPGLVNYQNRRQAMSGWCLDPETWRELTSRLPEQPAAFLAQLYAVNLLGAALAALAAPYWIFPRTGGLKRARDVERTAAALDPAVGDRQQAADRAGDGRHGDRPAAAHAAEGR